MNAKELEIFAKQLEVRLKIAEDRIQTDPVPELGNALQNLTDRLDRVVEGFTAKMAEEDIRIVTMINGLGESIRGEIKALDARIAEMEPKVNSTNKSAPSKRNMTDEDALKVLTGDLKELSHKDAAEQIGLTYAQVYSARGEFTFKHVHKELRDGGWKNPFVKK